MKEKKAQSRAIIVLVVVIAFIIIAMLVLGKTMWKILGPSG